MIYFSSNLFNFTSQIIGKIVIIRFIAILFIKLWKYLEKLIFPINFEKRYGKNSWVLITGASDGIGKEFSLNFAKKGFKICLIARNEEKLKIVEKEIKKVYKVQTKIIIADFKNSSKNEDFFTNIMKQLENCEISILINNVGISTKGDFLNEDENYLKEIIIVNCIPMVILSQKIMKKMKNRQNKSAIINISSLNCLRPMPGAQVYGATKIFNDYFSQTIKLENPEIDILSLRAGYVSTKLCKNKKLSFGTLNTNEFVEGCNNCLKFNVASSGNLRHEIIAFLINIFPDFVYNYLIKQFRKKRVEEIQKDINFHQKNE